MATRENSLKWSVIAAVNNQEVLQNCLLRSPEVAQATDLIWQQGYASAAAAYNAAIAKAKTDLLIFVHQDVYLPEGWIAAVKNAIEIVSRTDPDWGVLGVWGTQPSGGRAGFVYDGAWSRILGNQFEGGMEVDSLDEVVLILRKSTGLCFDPHIPGFHMYGADICLEARRHHKKCYAIAAFCIHNTNQYAMLPWQFWKGYLAMRRKWKARLPVNTTCTEITYWCWPMVRWNVVRAINLITGRDPSPVKRVHDPRQLYREMIASGRVSSVAFLD
jgi:glycosyltransferase involved in cell wall biosynthesis